jgi:hypothetical protein
LSAPAYNGIITPIWRDREGGSRLCAWKSFLSPKG